MSRSYCSYNEDWQRRKAILIRSLFHDLPVLSPVPEESSESIPYKQTEDVLHADDEDRPESPLPPLIIEKVPNRHDEPEEYYRKLLKKITRIYRKLFIENKDLSIEDLNLNSCDSSINNDHFEMAIDNNDNDASRNVTLDLTDTNTPIQGIGNFDSLDDNRESSNSSYSNGYGASSESSTSTEEWIDVENYSKSDEDVHMRYEEENSSNEQEMIEITNNLGNDRETITESDTVTDDSIEAESSISYEVTSETEQSSANTRIEDEESSKSTRSNNKIVDNPEINEDVDSNKIDDPGNNGTTNNVTNNRDSELKSKKSESGDFYNENKLKLSHDKAMEEYLETNTTKSDDTDYMQITTEAIIHVDGWQDAVERESRVYEDSVKSLILPTREFKSTIKARNADLDDRIEELSALEDNEDPDTTFDSVSEHIFEPIEVMRTPQPKISNESIPVRAQSVLDNTSEHTGLLENTELASVASSPQDGNNNVSQPKTSDDINDILNLIFNESHNKDTESRLKRKRKLCEDVSVQTYQSVTSREELRDGLPFEEYTKSPLTRKRKQFEDISVQTSQRVTWNELQGNFFVGTPKVFRLCACADHVCN